jgi:hypothetical protein
VNYYLDEIANILSQSNANLDYTGLDINSIKIDLLIESSDLTSQEEFILLYSEGGTTEPTITVDGDFAVYVYRTDPTRAGDDARIIHRYLTQYTGSLAVDSNSVGFKRIVTRQNPRRWATSNLTSQVPLHVFMFTMTAQYNDSDLLKIT